MASSSLILRSIYVQWLLVQLFPRLRAWPVPEWPAVLDEAVGKEFDRFERMGILGALLIATWLLQPEEGAVRSSAAVFLLAIPLLIVLAGPFYLRRIRRGIAELADRR